MKKKIEWLASKEAEWASLASKEASLFREAHAQTEQLTAMQVHLPDISLTSP